MAASDARGRKDLLIVLRSLSLAANGYSSYFRIKSISIGWLSTHFGKLIPQQLSTESTITAATTADRPRQQMLHPPVPFVPFPLIILIASPFPQRPFQCR